MKWSDLKNLELQNIGNWPVLAKVGAIALACAGILGAAWYFDTQKQRDELIQAEAKETGETGLRKTFEIKQQKAANLEALQQQMKEMAQSFGDMLRQLPNKTEVAALLVDISQTGLASGLEFDLFQPQKEQPSEFYAELPIKIQVAGDYHELGEFVSGVAALPRIVTEHDIIIVKDTKKEKGTEGELTMTATAKTYRAMDEEEEQSSEGAKPAGAAKRAGGAKPAGGAKREGDAKPPGGGKPAEGNQ